MPSVTRTGLEPVLHRMKICCPIPIRRSRHCTSTKTRTWIGWLRVSYSYHWTIEVLFPREESNFHGRFKRPLFCRWITKECWYAHLDSNQNWVDLKSTVSTVGLCAHMPRGGLEPPPLSLLKRFPLPIGVSWQCVNTENWTPTHSVTSCHSTIKLYRHVLLARVELAKPCF